MATVNLHKHILMKFFATVKKHPYYIIFPHAFAKTRTCQNYRYLIVSYNKNFRHLACLYHVFLVRLSDVAQQTLISRVSCRRLMYDRVR